VRTLTLKIRDDYFDKIVSFLEILPKRAVRIEDTSKQEDLDNLKNGIKNAMIDIKTGNSKIIRVID
jgi:hypothetical protein